jgi:O-antigen ligase
LLIDQAAALAVFYLLAAAPDYGRMQTRAGFLFAQEAIAACVALLAGIALLFNHSTGTRLAAGFGNPNLFASYLVLCCPLVAIGAMSRDQDVSRLRRAARWICLALLLVELWFTGSRAAMLGIAVCLAIMTFALPFRRPTRMPLAMLASLFVILTGSLGCLMMRHGPVASHGRSDQQRRIVWRAAVRIASAHPITGVGLGGFASAMRELKLREPNDASQSGLPMTPAVHLHAHDIFLQFAAERGLTSLICVAFMAIAIVLRTLSPRSLRSLPSSSLAAGIGLIGLVVQNLFDYTLWYAPLLILAWALAGILAASPDAVPEQTRLSLDA